MLRLGEGHFREDSDWNLFQSKDQPEGLAIHLEPRVGKWQDRGRLEDALSIPFACITQFGALKLHLKADAK